jgi:HNH endonuclease
MPEVDSALRQHVRARASGCCEYCGISERFTLAEHEIDHVIARKHGGATEESNLALSCTLCNRFKGSDIASIDPESSLLVPLFNPRTDRREEHYRLHNGEFVALTAIGRATVRLLRLNIPARVRERNLLPKLLL